MRRASGNWTPVSLASLASLAFLSTSCASLRAFHEDSLGPPAWWAEEKKEPEARLVGRVYHLPEGAGRSVDLEQLAPVSHHETQAIEVYRRHSSCGFPGVKDRSSWFAVRYDGLFTVAEQGIYKMRLTSPDGARVWIDGDRILDNDGASEVAQAETYRHFVQGRHTITVAFVQGAPDTTALVLEVAEKGRPYKVFHVDQPLGIDPPTTFEWNKISFR